MSGLLYKDFIAIKGKLLSWLLISLTAAYITLRVFFPGTVDISTGFFFVCGELTFLLMGCYFINSLSAKIIQLDEKDKIREYLSSMPIEKKTYVKSKFVFIGISTYILFSFYMIWHIVSLAFMAEGYNKEISYLLAGFALPFVSLVFLVSMTELLLYLIIGKTKAQIIKECLWILIGLLILAYLFFGDLNIFENWDIERLLNWAEAHEFSLTLLSVLSPLAVLLFGYILCHLGSKLYERKENVDA